MTTATDAPAAGSATPPAGEPAAAERVQWGRLIAATVARFALVFAASMVAWGVLPAVIGWHPTVVMSGSMEPKLHVGDLTVSRPVQPDQLAVGQVVLVHDPDHPGKLRLHRLHAFEPDGTLQLKGDANPDPDSSHVQRSAVLGVGVLRVPWVGLPSVWASEHRVFPLVALGVGLVAAVGLASLRTGEDARSEGMPSARRTRRVRIAVCIGTAAVLATAATFAGTRAEFFATSSNTGNAWQTPTFTKCQGADGAIRGISPPTFAFTYSGLVTLGGLLGVGYTDATGNKYNAIAQGLLSVINLGTTGPCTADSSNTSTQVGSGVLGLGLPPYIYVTNPSGGADPAPSGSVTVLTWFRLSSGSTGRLMGYGDAKTGTSQTTAYALYLDSTGHLAFAAGSGTANAATSTTSPVPGAGWHLAVGTYTAGTTRVYLDGVMVGQTTGTKPGSVGSGYWRFGQDTLSGYANFPSSGTFNGYIADTAVYPVALTPGQISWLYHASGR